MAQDLSGLYISQSFQNLVQRSASGAFNVLATATGTEFIPISASYAISASQAQSVVSASYAVSASHANTALSSSYAVSASFAQRAISSSHSDVNLQEVLQNGNSASIAINLTASLNTTGSLTEHKNEFKVTAQDKDTDFDVAAFKIKNNGAGKTIITGSVEITGSSSVEGISTVSLNSSGNSPKIIIKDDANTSFSVGPTLRFTGSRVGKIETERNFQIDVEGSGDTIFNAGNQYLFTKNSFQSGDFKITDPGSRTAFYQHENLTETGSVRFANTTTDAGIGLRMDDNQMALQMYSGSAFHPIIRRASGSQQVNLYDSSRSTGSADQVLKSNANGGIEWGVAAGDPFPYTGSAQITGSLAVTGSTNISLNELGTAPTLIIQDDANNSFSIGPTLKFSGSSVGIIESDTNKNLTIEATQDLNINVENQFGLTKDNSLGDAYQFINNGSLWAKFQNENLRSTGSITFADPTIDVGIGLRMDNDKMALQMYSGSSFAPIIQRLSGSKQINLYDSTSSTGSSAQVLTSNANGGIEWGVGASDPFPFTGSAQITGSLIVTGSVSLGNIPSRNTINASAQGALVHGDGNAINSTGEDNAIIAGESNAINSGGYSAIIGAAGSSLTNVDTSIIAGGYQNTVQGTRTFIMGGNQNTVASGTEHSGVIGGQFNQVNSNITGSVVIGGKNIGADKADTVFVPALNVGKGTRPGDVIVEAGSVNVTGSIVGSTSILAGQNAAAFSSDAVRLGNATTPVQYGNMIIHTDTSGAMLGNQYNGFTIDDPGTSNIQFASSAFTGLGNTVHLLAMGANSVGRTDTIKLWSSGSGADLNLSTDVVIQSGNKLTMSGSIELAGVTGSVGQSIGVDASGKAKWENTIKAFSWTGTTYTQATAPGCDYVFAVTDVIPGGTFGPGDILEVRSMDQKAGSSGTTYTLIAAVNTGSLSAGVARPANFRGLSQNQESSDGKIYYQKTIYIDTAGSSSLWDEGNSTETYQNGVVGGDPMTEYSPAQLNWANDVVVFYGACIDNAGTTLQNFGGTIRKIN